MGVMLTCETQEMHKVLQLEKPKGKRLLGRPIYIYIYIYIYIRTILKWILNN